MWDALYSRSPKQEQFYLPGLQATVVVAASNASGIRRFVARRKAAAELAPPARGSLVASVTAHALHNGTLMVVMMLLFSLLK